MILTTDNQYQSTKHVINSTVSISFKFSNSLHVRWTPSLNHYTYFIVLQRWFGAFGKWAQTSEVCFTTNCRLRFQKLLLIKRRMSAKTIYEDVYEYSYHTYVVLIWPRFHLRQIKRWIALENDKQTNAWYEWIYDASALLRGLAQPQEL